MVILLGGVFAGWAWGDESPTSRCISSAPASQPDSEIILARIADRITITQADFADAVRSYPLEEYDIRYPMVMRNLLEQRLFELYVQDHPDLVTDEKLDAKIADEIKTLKMKSLDDLKKRLEEKKRSYELYRRVTRLQIAKAELARQGEASGKDDDVLKKIYNSAKSEFDGTYVVARHIMLLVVPYEKPAERLAKRERLAEMRADILAGRRTWEQCVAESDSKANNGSLGEFTRHRQMNEIIAKAAFELKEGEFSDIVETLLGYHIIQVTKRVEGARPFEEAKVKRNMRLYLSTAGYENAIMEAIRKYPVVGVHPPTKPSDLTPAEIGYKNTGFPLMMPKKPSSLPATGPAVKRPPSAPKLSTMPARKTKAK